MVDQQQQSSSQIISLRLFLQKCSTDFSRENRDLREWLQDRALHIEQLGLSNQDQNPYSENENVVGEVLRATAQELSRSQLSILPGIAQEEFEVIMAKMIRVLELPAGKLERDSALYLEQQLSDMLGFEVSGNLEGQSMSYSTGTMVAGLHLKRSPTDSISKHDAHLESGMAPSRGSFGWFSHSTTLEEKAIATEKYYVALPLYTDPDWTQDQQKMRQWYAFRKVLVVNPAEHVAVVARVGLITPPLQTKYQFVGSSEVVREGFIWSPKAKGKVFVFFIDDPEDSIALGSINLEPR